MLESSLVSYCLSMNNVYSGLGMVCIWLLGLLIGVAPFCLFLFLS